MAQQEIYGRVPHGVRTTLTGSGVSSEEGGRRQKGVIVGRASPDAQDYAVNELRELNLKSDIERKFGSFSAIGVELEAALLNGGDRRDVRGVAPEEVSVTEEQIPGGSGVLENAPIVESASQVQITVDNGDGTTTEYTPNFTYESLPTVPSGESDVVNINPNSGETEGPTDDDYLVSYKYLDWQTALNVAAEYVSVGEVGGIYCLSSAQSVAAMLDEIVDVANEGTDTTGMDGAAIRQDYRLAWGLIEAEPNATDAAGNAIIDPEEYSDSFDNDALFIAGAGRINPASQQSGSAAYGTPLATPTPGVPKNVLGGMFGKMLGNQMQNPVYGDSLKGYGDIEFSQSLVFNGDAANAFRDSGVIPMIGPRMSASGLPTIGDNISTSTATDYVRDYHRLTIKDNVNLNFKNLAEAARTEILVTGEDGILQETEDTGLEIMRRLASQNIIVGDGENQTAADTSGPTNGTASALDRTQPAEATGTPDAGNQSEEDDEAPYDVTVSRGDTDEIVIEYEFVPIPIVKSVQNYGTISDQVSSDENTTA